MTVLSDIHGPVTTAPLILYKSHKTQVKKNFKGVYLYD